MNHAAEFKRCMEELDVAAVRRLHAHVSPHLPQPKTDAEALATLHIARTQSPLLEDGLRFYSHAWLLDRGLPSQLPDNLKPKAERLYPRQAHAVGLSVNVGSPLLEPAVPIIEGAINAAIGEAFDDGRGLDVAFVKARMGEARDKIKKQLFGRWSPAA